MEVNAVNVRVLCEHLEKLASERALFVPGPVILDVWITQPHLDQGRVWQGRACREDIDRIGHRHTEDQLAGPVARLVLGDGKPITVVIFIKGSPSFAATTPVQPLDRSFVIEMHAGEKRHRDRGESAEDNGDVVVRAACQLSRDQSQATVDFLERALRVMNLTISNSATDIDHVGGASSDRWKTFRLLERRIVAESEAS